MNSKKVGLYARTSTIDQKSGLESQLRALQEYCERNKITNYEVFADDGISGTQASRPSLDRMMAMARAGELERIVVYSFSRYARSVTHLLSALEELRALNVAFISYTENIDTNSPMGKAFFVIIAAVSALERDLIAERVKNGLKNARLKGKHIGRKKTRPSEIIRALRASGLSMRECSRISGASHGSVSLEMKVWAEEARRQGKTLKEVMEVYRRSATARKKSETGEAALMVEAVPGLNGMELGLSDAARAIEFEITR